jgi:hypothetical protein
MIREPARRQGLQLLTGQGRKLSQAGMQALQFSVTQRVEVNSRIRSLCPRVLQPTQQDLGGTRI